MRKNRTKIVLLGTGTPIPDPSRSGPSVAIIVEDESYIVDFGSNVVRQAVNAYSQLGIKALESQNLKNAFLTHLHTDHTLGYPDLIFTPWVMGRGVPLEIYGPKGTQEMTRNILEAYREDIRERTEGLESANEKGSRVNVHEIKKGLICQDSIVQIEAFPVNHGIWPAYGFKFITEDRTIVISGDTAPFNEMFDYYKNCDVLIHEVYLTSALKKRPKHWQTYHSKVHTSSIELSQIASKVNPKLLVLYHQLFWNENEEDILLEIKQNYDGEVVSGRDMDIF
jgi:ribonuclease BN (tRNA processing enzyme)